MKVLALSDKLVPFIYGPQARQRFKDVDLIIGCGDLPYYYLEYILTTLNAPLFYVRGNHDKIVEYSSAGQRTNPHGGVDLHKRVIQHGDLYFAGVEGSLQYSSGPFQYSQAEMWWHVWSLVPGMVLNRLSSGRFLDVFVTHAPADGIHDREDLPHQGIKAFRWLVNVFKPAYHFHGHIHLYRPDAVTQSLIGSTQVVNTYPYLEMALNTTRPDNKLSLEKP
jgi:Icc-related predicted phosphoesterase